MPKYLQSKGQFFFISLMLIITFLSGLQVLMAGYSDIDLNKPYMRQEEFWAENIKYQLNRTFEREPCPDVEESFEEIEIMTKNYLAKKGIDFELEALVPICSPSGAVQIEMNLTSSSVQIRDIFTLTSHD